ncbi:MAG: hypothetical protein ACXWP5_07630 [Bdellovibrionota bacterium]
MASQERNIILRRLLVELRLIAQARNGLTIRELRERLAATDPELRFTERTIRRDCETLEELGIVDPRPDGETPAPASNWRLRLSAGFYESFRVSPR